MQMIGVIGNGSWATALAKMLTHNCHKIWWWMRNEASVKHLVQKQHNLQYLTSVQFSNQFIEPTTNLNELIQNCSVIIICIPSAYLQPVMDKIDTNALVGKTIISAVKGILPQQFQLLNDYLRLSKGMKKEQYISITGPCHAEEVAQERLSYLTFSGIDIEKTKRIASLFESDFIRVNTNCDIYGAQYASVLKNIYAIGAGIAHSMGYGDNFLSVYITNCYREMYHFLEDRYKNDDIQLIAPDFHTSAYLGDLLVTCYSLHSRNRTFGAYLGKQYAVKAAITEMDMVAEGYFAAKGMKKITAQLDMDLPILNILYQIMWEELQVKEGFHSIESLLT